MTPVNFMFLFYAFLAPMAEKKGIPDALLSRAVIGGYTAGKTLC